VRDIVESKYVNKSSFEIVSINQEKATSYLLKKRDIVIVRSASPGESLIVLEDVQNLIYSGFSIRLRCHDQSNSLFLFQFLQSYKKEMDIFSDGTTLKNINQEILNSIELVVPDKEIVEKYNSRVTNVFSKILINQEQIRTLSTLRDSLLPRLMSGEVRVKV
jgi:type I restriction enzyme S subunit